MFKRKIYARDIESIARLNGPCMRDFSSSFVGSECWVVVGGNYPKSVLKARIIERKKDWFRPVVIDNDHRITPGGFFSHGDIEHTWNTDQGSPPNWRFSALDGSPYPDGAMWESAMCIPDGDPHAEQYAKRAAKDYEFNEHQKQTTRLMSPSILEVGIVAMESLAQSVRGKPIESVNDDNEPLDPSIAIYFQRNKEATKWPRGRLANQITDDEYRKIYHINRDYLESLSVAERWQKSRRVYHNLVLNVDLFGIDIQDKLHNDFGKDLCSRLAAPFARNLVPHKDQYAVGVCDYVGDSVGLLRDLCSRVHLMCRHGDPFETSLRIPGLVVDFINSNTDDLKYFSRIRTAKILSEED